MRNSQLTIFKFLLVLSISLFISPVVHAEDETVTVPYTITGVDKDDLEEALSGSLTFKKGQTTREIKITPKKNGDSEASEKVTVKLEPVPDSLNLVGKGSVTGTILNGDVNHCDPNPCKNNAQCTSGDTTFSCTCNAAYEGETCDKPIAPSGGSVNASATSVDSEGKINVSASGWSRATVSPLSYNWSSNCEGGSFNDDKANVEWTAPKNTTGKVQTCALTVEIEDTGNKGKTTSSKDVTVNSATSSVGSTISKSTDAKVVKKVVSIKPEKTEYKQGEDKEIIFTVTLSCPAGTKECPDSANECAKSYSDCPGGPFGGTISVSPTSVIELTDEVTVTASGWRSSVEGSLDYRWYIDYGQGKRLVAAEKTSSFVLSAGTCEVTLVVTDGYGRATTSASTIVQVKPLDLGGIRLR